MSKNIHFIAIGGSAMHNLALALHDMGHNVTGSDDEIYEPSKTRLDQAGILPHEFGWFPSKINNGIDSIILGMHAKPNNPELLKGIELGLPIYSYPEYVALQSQNQKRVVIAGSHGKTTTTAMIMHVLGKLKMQYDYLVGAQLEGFDRMVKLTGAPLIILEGDEYLSSPIDRRPKMYHYDPDIAVVTGIAWDHINVFPTFEVYTDQFRQFVNDMKAGTKLFYHKEDPTLSVILSENNHNCIAQPYSEVDQHNGEVSTEGSIYMLNVIGRHNMQNMEAARLVCNELRISNRDFFMALTDFTGAAKRLQYRGKRGEYRVYQDFAHAPSKVRATCSAVKDWFQEEKLYVIFELHTYSSLNKDFLPQYKNALSKADVAIVVFDEHTLKMKDMPPLNPEYIKDQFDHPNLQVISNNKEVENRVKKLPLDGNVILMSSGTFGGLDWESIVDNPELPIK